MQIVLQDYMTVKEAAAALRVTDRRIRSLVAEGRLHAQRPGERMLLITRDSVQAESDRRIRTGRTLRKTKAVLAS